MAIGCFLLLSACASTQAKQTSDCLRLSGGYELCAATIWAADNPNGASNGFRPMGNEKARIFTEVRSYSDVGIDKNDFLPRIVTAAVNNALCRGGSAFDLCAYDRTYTSFSGSRVALVLQKRRGESECHSVNTNDQNGITRFSVCDRAGSEFFGRTNLRKLASDALKGNV